MKPVTIKIIVMLVSGWLFVTACSEQPGQSATSGDKPLAEVNGKTLTSEDLNAYLRVKNIPADQQQRVDAAFAQLLDREIQSTKIEAMASFDKSTVDMEVAEFKRQLLITRYFEQFIKNKVTETAVRNYYASNADNFTISEMKVSHILVRTNQATSENEKNARLTKINEAYGKLIKGEPFETIVAQYSEDRNSSAKSGDLGWVKKGGIHPRFSEVVYAMQAGEFSKPFETPLGFHIVKVEEFREVTQPFDSVKGNIRYQLRNEAKAAEVERLKQESDVTVYYGQEKE